jgi:hypothetical protein
VAVIACAAVYLVAAARRVAVRPASREPEPRPSPARPLQVVYTPPTPGDLDPEVRQLEESLLRLCRGDRNVYDRLIAHERCRDPRLTPAKLLRAAIDHYLRDHA